MSSLQSIMNADEDQHDASSPTPMDKKDKVPATPASGFRGQDPSSSSTVSGHVIRSGQQPSSTYTSSTSTAIVKESNIARSGHPPIDEGPASSSAAQEDKRRAGPSDPRARTSTANTATTTSRPGLSRRQSTTSVESMDQYGYGSASSSSFGGAGSGGLPPNHPTRPMGSPNPEVPIRLTPITGRVSRAKKGVPVHTCEMCNPPKTFTRAEHLRRHQLSHQTPRFPCTYPGCDRAFHRPDLLLRHQQRHEQEGDKASRSDSRRPSGASGASPNPEEGRSGLQGSQPRPGYAANPSGPRGPSTPSSTSDMPPRTPNMSNTSFSQGGSPATGGTGHTTTHDSYGLSSGPGPASDYESYSLHPRVPFNGDMSSSPEPPNFNGVEYIPRSMPLYVATQNLSPSATLQTSLDNPPDLIHTTDWTSASESNYSTPPSDLTASRGYWDPHRSHSSLGWQTNTNMLSPFAPNAQRDHGSLQTVAAPQYVTTHFSMSPHLAPAPFQAYSNLIDTSLMGGFADDQTQQSLLDPSITAHAAVQDRSSSVRSPTPPPSSAQAADTLVTPAPLPHRINPMALVNRQKEMVIGGGNVAAGATMLGGGGSSPSWASDSPGDVLTGTALTGGSGCGIGGTAVVTPSVRSVRNAVPAYLEVYWERFHPFYPIVHRCSVEGAGQDVLRCAMAALATQYLNSKEDRIRGNQLHEYAWQEAKRYPSDDLSAMQAILLCEYFARFRGRKAVVRPSKQFESLYSRVLGNKSTMYNTPVGQSNLELQMTNEERWHIWIDGETRRRLFALSFIMDNHAAHYFQQSRARTDVDPSSMSLTGPSDALWAANSADEWAAAVAANPVAGNPQYLPHLDTLTPEEVAGYSYLDQAIILHAETHRLPRRHYRRSTADKGDELDDNSPDDLETPTAASFGQTLRGAKAEDRIVHLFSKAALSISANVYLALHYTPLHDLLAVSGDSYVFCQKVLNAPTFQEHQKRLKAWAEGRTSSSPTSPQGSSTSLEGLSSAKATLYAARALAGFLDRSPDASNGVTPYVTCVSNYWGMYVCALIVWAFGHRASVRASSSSSSGTTSTGTSTGSPTKGGAMGEEDAAGWLRLASEVSQPEQIARMRGRREAGAGVVSLVRRRLEADCVGPRSQLYVDAVGVLKKLEDGVNRRWF